MPQADATTKDTNPAPPENVPNPEQIEAANRQFEYNRIAAAAKAAKLRETEESASTKIDNPDGYPLYVSLSGKPVLLATLGGHTQSVGAVPTPLHPRYQKMAGAKGVVNAEIADVMRKQYAAPNNVRGELPRARIIKNAITDMVAEASDDLKRQVELFTNDGAPSTDELSKRCGFHVSASDRDDAWASFDAGDEGGALQGGEDSKD